MFLTQGPTAALRSKERIANKFIQGGGKGRIQSRFFLE
jgi:hypothetical protein